MRAFNESGSSPYTTSNDIHTLSLSNDVRLAFDIGAEEKVFDYSADHCDALDVPDIPVRAIRNSQGQIVLAAGNAPKQYFMFGSDFDHLTSPCTSPFLSEQSWDIEKFKHFEWITSMYTTNGTTVYALVHNEYHDPYAPNCKPGVISPGNPCWYNFLTFAKSTDGGHTFTQPESPNHIVAMMPFTWNPGATSSPPSVYGYFEASNIIKGKDNFYYSAFFGIAPPAFGSVSGTCIMRTASLDNPSSWKLWNGSSFSIPLLNPYLTSLENPAQYFCIPIGSETLMGLRGSLTYNTYLHKYVMLGVSAFPDASGKPVCGFYLSLSGDLITWGMPKLLKTTPSSFGACAAPGPPELYPSIIDHDAPDINFTQTDSTFYLYFMRNNNGDLDRDLIRVPVAVSQG